MEPRLDEYSAQIQSEIKSGSAELSDLTGKISKEQNLKTAVENAAFLLITYKLGLANIAGLIKEGYI
ncbi:MAG: hypothetical protein KKF44_06135 [Nanoarchaeota archaeon]|nr:hypothetical protein [Nanoarchaeota archaeon]